MSPLWIEAPDTGTLLNLDHYTLIYKVKNTSPGEKARAVAFVSADRPDEAVCRVWLPTEKEMRIFFGEVKALLLTPGMTHKEQQYMDSLKMESPGGPAKPENDSLAPDACIDCTDRIINQ